METDVQVNQEIYQGLTLIINMGELHLKLFLKLLWAMKHQLWNLLHIIEETFLKVGVFILSITVNDRNDNFHSDQWR